MAYAALEAAGFTPLTDNYYALFDNEYLFPIAVGQRSDDYKNCYFIANGYMTNLVVVQDNIASDVEITQITREAFLTSHPDESGSLFVQTSIEELKKVYIGEKINEY